MKLFEQYRNMMSIYGINTPRRIAMFLAQCHHESGGFTRVSENLNYSAVQLKKTWPNRFNSHNAAEYAHHPEKIANNVYALRMGNGNEASGDGWCYRGRGYIQVTGRKNYTAFAIHKKMTLDAVIGYVQTEEGALESAAWFWFRADLSALADTGDVKAVTLRINGGLIGLDERKSLYEQYLKEITVA